MSRRMGSVAVPVLLALLVVRAEGALRPAGLARRAEGTSRLEVTKSLRLLGRDSGEVGPGDTIGFTITLRNRSARPLADLVFADPPVPHARLRTGTVVASHGRVTTGEKPGDTLVAVRLRLLPPGAEATVSYEVTLDDPLPEHVSHILTQGIAYGPGLGGVPTDDPATPFPGDPTLVPIGLRPWLESDVTGSAALGHTARVVNRGSAEATGVVFRYGPEDGFDLEAGSVACTHGSVTRGNAPGDTEIVVEVESLPPGAAVEVSFRGARSAGGGASNPVAAAVEEGDAFLEPAPLLEAYKVDFLIEDADRDGRASPGDGLGYLVLAGNLGGAAAPTLLFWDQPDVDAPLVPGSVVTSTGGLVLLGNKPGHTTVAAYWPDLAPGGVAAAFFAAAIRKPLPEAAGGVEPDDRCRSLPAFVPGRPRLAGPGRGRPA